MANRHRGEVDAVIDGVSASTVSHARRSCRTRSRRFGAGDLVALARRFESGQLSARDIQLIIASGLRGGGQTVTDADVAAMTFPGGLSGAIRIAVDLIAVTFGTEVRQGGGRVKTLRGRRTSRIE